MHAHAALVGAMGSHDVQKRPWLIRFVHWAAWPLVVSPAMILLHELGHLLAGFVLGFPDPTLHFSSVSHGDISRRPDWQFGIFGLAGPVVSAVFVVSGIGLSLRYPRMRLGYALAVTAVSRFFVGVPYTVANLIVLASGRRLQPPAFDEYKAGEALGWSGNLTLGVTAAMVFAVFIWLIFALPKGERAAAWPGLVLGTAAGWALWFGLGPLLLP